MSSASWLRSALRVTRTLLTCGRKPESFGEVMLRQNTEFERAVTLVRVIYVFAAFWMILTMDSWNEWEHVQKLYPLWPLAWLEYVDLQRGLQVICITSLVSAIAAAIFPHVRAMRIAATVGLLWWSALVNSLSGVTSMHGLHALIWVSAILVWLPSGPFTQVAKSRIRRLHFTRIFWLAQATVLFFYSSGGFFKIAAAIVQFAAGEAHSFSPDALARHIAFRVEEGCRIQNYIFWGGWLIERPSWGILIYPPAIYLEFCSFLVAFRPSLHKLWATGLLLMHVGIATGMAIGFPVQCIVLGLLFFASPFEHRPVSLREVVAQLPLLGDALRLRPRIQRWMSRQRLTAPP